MTMKDIRNSTGLSQKRFSEKYNIPRRTIEDWETGKRIPPVYVIDMIEWRVNTDIRDQTYVRLKSYTDRMNIPMKDVIDKSITDYLDKEENK